MRNRWIHHQIRDVSISNLAAKSPVPRVMAYAYLKRPFPFQATEHAAAVWRVPVPNLCLTDKQQTEINRESRMRSVWSIIQRRMRHMHKTDGIRTRSSPRSMARRFLLVTWMDVAMSSFYSVNNIGFYSILLVNFSRFVFRQG